MKAKISVIMGVYNDKKYLNDAIDSILNQTCKDFEFLICNDCSEDDDIQKILDSYRLSDSRVKLLKNDVNSGLAASLNRCLQLAEGEYIARMDSDDISEPDRFEKQIDFLNANPNYDICSGKIHFIDDNGIWGELNRNGEVSLYDVYKGGAFVHPAVMMRKEALTAVGGYTSDKLTRRAEDYDLWCKMYLNGSIGYNMDEFLLLYREDSNSYKKRKLSTRIEKCRLSHYWRKRLGLSLKWEYYSIRPIIAGLVPKKILLLRRKRKGKIS